MTIKWGIIFPAHYAKYHHGGKTRNVFVQPFKREGKDILRRLAQAIKGA